MEADEPQMTENMVMQQFKFFEATLVNSSHSNIRYNFAAADN